MKNNSNTTSRQLMLSRQLVTVIVGMLAALLVGGSLSPAEAATVTITASSYNQENVEGKIKSVTQLGGVPDSGKIEVAYESTNVKAMSKKKVLKRCVKLTNIRQLKKAMKTKRFKKYGLICFMHGVVIKERWRTAEGFANVKMPPVWGDFRVGKFNKKSREIRAQGTWFSTKRLRDAGVRAQMIQLGVPAADIDQAIAKGGGWFLMCNNLLVSVHTYTWQQVHINKVLAKKEFSIEQELTGTGIAEATGSCPDGTSGTAKGSFGGTATNTISYWAFTKLEAEKYASEFNAQPIPTIWKDKVKANAEANLTQWATASVTLECKDEEQPPPPPVPVTGSVICADLPHIYVPEGNAILVCELSKSNGVKPSLPQFDIVALNNRARFAQPVVTDFTDAAELNPCPATSLCVRVQVWAQNEGLFEYEATFMDDTHRGSTMIVADDF